MNRPRRCAPLCRPEVGVPSRPRAFCRLAMCGSHPCGVRCRPPPGGLAGGRRSKPSPRLFPLGDVRCPGWLHAKKLMAANSVRCPRDRGESVKGGLPPPFHKKVTTHRNLPPRARGYGRGTRLRGIGSFARGAGSLGRVSRSRAMPVGDRRSTLDLQCRSPYTIRPVSDAYNQTGTVTRAQRR